MKFGIVLVVLLTIGAGICLFRTKRAMLQVVLQKWITKAKTVNEPTRIPCGDAAPPYVRRTLPEVPLPAMGPWSEVPLDRVEDEPYLEVRVIFHGSVQLPLTRLVHKTPFAIRRDVDHVGGGLHIGDDRIGHKSCLIDWESDRMVLQIPKGLTNSPMLRTPEGWTPCAGSMLISVEAGVTMSVMLCSDIELQIRALPAYVAKVLSTPTYAMLVLEGDGETRRFRAMDGADFAIGSSLNMMNDVVLKDFTVSPKHFQIQFCERELQVTSFASGTKALALNGREYLPKDTRRPLWENDVLTFGCGGQYTLRVDRIHRQATDAATLLLQQDDTKTYIPRRREVS